MRGTFVIGLVIACSVTLGAGQPQQPAAPASGSDEGAIVEQVRTTMRFEDEGTGSRALYARIKAVSEAGVQQWGQLVVGYNAATERIDIPLVRVHKADGTVVDTPASSVQDLTSPVERIAPVYTDLHQKHVTVQSFRPGDTLEFRMVTTIHTPLAPRQFWADYSFNEDAVVLDEQLDIDVPAARHVTVKTRAGYEPQVRESGGRRVYHWARAHPVRDKEQDQKKDAPKKPEGEIEWPPVRLTTFADWAEVGRWFAGLEKTARQASPEVKAKAAELTRGRTTDLEKLEALYDYVSKNFRYVSLSLGLGRYQPRDAGDVLRDAYGDCKDKHTLLAALIDAAGMQASAALINSSVRIDPEFPSPAQFDHVITRAVAGGQVVWLDATPEVAPFRLLAPTLRARQALVTDIAPARLETTPPDPPTPSGIDTVVDGALDAAGTLKAHVLLTFRGDLELPMRIGFRLTPAARWQTIAEQIVQQEEADAKISAVKVSDPQATREPFTVGFDMEEAGFADLSRKKVDLRLPLDHPGGQPTLPDNDPIPIGGPNHFEYRLTLRLPQGVKARTPLPVAVTRDYGEFHSRYGADGALVTAGQFLTLSVRELPDARRSDLTSFLQVARSASGQAVSLDASAVTATTTPAPAVEAKRLNQAGYDAMEAGEYERAIDLLKRVVALEPANKTAWGYLGSAYKSVHRYADAVAAYTKQVEVDPYREYAYTNLGIAEALAGDDAAAEAAFVKQLEINPLDRFAHSNLGDLYFRTRKFDKAAEAYEHAASIAPDAAYLQTDLGKTYAKLKNTDKAREAFAHAVELSATPGTWNDVAYQLALSGIDLDRAQQYAESAVASVTAASRNLDIQRADATAFAVVSSLAAYWDTLGWVDFVKGDSARALQYVAPAWALAGHAEVGDHLGQIYEKLGQRDKAIAAYAAAVSAPDPVPEAREHLVRLAGAAQADAAVAAHRNDTLHARTLPLHEKGPAGKTGDFVVLFSAPDMVESVRFVEGDEALRPMADAIHRFPAAGMFPDGGPARILRRATVACDAKAACSLTLVIPEDARPVK
jgi:tetratricopeptide (TPR) repeat protein/transglutaminase-like putative cysteine protease